MKNKKFWYISGIALGIIIIVVILYFAFRKPKPAGATGTGTQTGGGGGSLYEKDSKCPLKLGSGGNNVKALQRFLNKSGSYGLVVDGKFGLITQAAVLSETGKTTVDCQYFASFIESYPEYFA